MIRARITKKAKVRAGRPPEKEAPKFLKWVAREHNCILSATGECQGKVMACHWDEAGDKGMSTKVSDCWSLPMCFFHHDQQTTVLGWPKFAQKYGFDPEAMCKVLWNSWPGRAEWNRALAAHARTRVDAPMVLR